ncbi:hypothetical protein ALC56_12025, partial [Trachymyrmex septentrionalis]
VQLARGGSRIAESATRVSRDGKMSLRRRWRRKQRNQEVRGGKGDGGGNGEEQEKGEDEACNTMPLLAVDLSARSIRWRKRRSAPRSPDPPLNGGETRRWRRDEEEDVKGTEKNGRVDDGGRSTSAISHQTVK